MRKSFFVTIFALLLVGILLPSIVNAEDGFVTVAEDTVYYKTIVKFMCRCTSVAAHLLL